MVQSTWSYLQNPFANVTKNSFKTMYLMATDHFDKLQAQSSDPAIADLYNLGKPAFDAFILQYRKNGTDNTTYQMHTMQFENLIGELMSTYARQWDVKTQIVFDINKPQYLELFANGRAPFQTGAYDLRINAVKALADQLAHYPALAALQLEVNNFHADILATRSAQQGVENTNQRNSTNLENARLTLAQAMHAIFGGLILQYASNIAVVESFYELKYLRRTPGTTTDDAPEASEEVTIAKGSAAKALIGKLSAGDSIRVTNTGAAVLTVYSAPDGSDSNRPDNVYTIAAGQTATFQSGAGDILVLLINEVDAFDGKALVELL